MKTAIFLFFCFSIFSSVRSQSLTATADKENILIGEQLKLNLSGAFKNGTSFSWFSIDSIPHFEILQRSKIDTVQNADGIVLKQEFTLTSWDSGQQQIPSFSLMAAKTRPVNILVSYTPFDPNQPYHDIKEIIEVQKPAESKWHWYLIGILVLVALFLLFFPKDKKKEKTAFVPDEGAYKNALRKIGALRSKQFTDPKQLHTELIEIFRDYLHKRRNMQSFSKTTDDLSIQVEHLGIEREAYQQLVQSLRLTDLVKYARFIPDARENENTIDTIEQGIVTIEQLPYVV